MHNPKSSPTLNPNSKALIHKLELPNPNAQSHVHACVSERAIGLLCVSLYVRSITLKSIRCGFEYTSGGLGVGDYGEVEEGGRESGRERGRS